MPNSKGLYKIKSLRFSQEAVGIPRLDYDGFKVGDYIVGTPSQTQHEQPLLFVEKGGILALKDCTLIEDTIYSFKWYCCGAMASVRIKAKNIKEATQQVLSTQGSKGSPTVNITELKDQPKAHKEWDKKYDTQY